MIALGPQDPLHFREHRRPGVWRHASYVISKIQSFACGETERLIKRQRARRIPKAFTG